MNTNILTGYVIDLQVPPTPHAGTRWLSVESFIKAHWDQGIFVSFTLVVPFIQL